MLLLIWMYICIIILFFGAEFNTLIEKNILKPLRISKKQSASYSGSHHKSHKNKNK